MSKLNSSIKSLSVATPYRYAISVSVLIVICIMLVLASFYFQSYNSLETQAKQQLRTDSRLLSAFPKQLNQLKNIYQDDYIITLKKPIPIAWQKRLQNNVVKLSDTDIKQLHWQELGLSSGTLVTVTDSPSGQVLLAKQINHHDFLRLLLKSLIYLFIAIFLIMLIYSFIISSRMARRIAQIDSTAKEIMHGNRQKRIPIRPEQRDEYTQLSVTLNSMLDRMDTLVRDLRQVNNNIAHDLKTPLNRLRSRLEIALLHPADNDYTEILADSIEDIDELLNIFNALLLIGNLDSDSRNYQLTQENASELLQNLGELYQAIAEEKQHQFTINITDNVFLLMNKTLFSQAISNLLDNAIKYTPNGGNIDLTLKTHNDTVIITITDSGIGIPASQREKVFERFTRLDQSRQLPGTGLGMALVKSIMKIHHANIHLSDNQPSGLKVEIQLRK